MRAITWGPRVVELDMVGWDMGTRGFRAGSKDGIFKVLVPNPSNVFFFR